MQPGVSQRVITDRDQYSPQRAVEITGYLFNDGPMLLSYMIGPRFEFELRVRESRSRKVVWTWSKNKSAPRGEIVKLESGQWREHREIWDRRDDSGRRVPAGVYDVELVHLPLTGAVATQIYLMDKEQPGRDPLPQEPPTRSDPPSRIIIPRPGGPTGGLTVKSTIQADRNRVRAGQSLRLTYTVVNTGLEPLTFAFSSGRQCDLEVRRRPEPNARYAAGALTVWQLSREKFYIQALTRFTLTAGQSRIFTEVWVVPAALAAGVYELVGYLPTMGGGNQAQAISTVTVTV